MADSEERSRREIDPRVAAGEVRSLQTLASKNFGGIEESQEVARQSAQKFLFLAIAGCLGFLALFDSALLVPSVRPEMKVIVTVNAAFAGSSGLLGLCARYILSPYRTSRPRKKPPKSKANEEKPVLRFSKSPSASSRSRRCARNNS